LDAFSGRRCRSGQSGCAPHNPTRALDSPEPEIIGDFKCYGHEFNAPELADQAGKNGRPSSCLAPEDRLQSLALPLVGPLVDEEAHPNLGLIGPDIAFEGTQRQQIEIIKLDIAKMTFANMPGEHSRTRIVRRRLSKFTRTGNAATADVEPISGEAPIGNCVHLTPLQDTTGVARWARAVRLFGARTSDDGSSSSKIG
jgi:hypothetical protein